MSHDVTKGWLGKEEVIFSTAECGKQNKNKSYLDPTEVGLLHAASLVRLPDYNWAQDPSLNTQKITQDLAKEPPELKKNIA